MIPEEPPNQCPAEFASNAPINTAISIKLAGTIDAASVQPDSLTLQCGGLPIRGALSAIESRLILTPDTDLDPGLTCVADLGQTLQYEDGRMVDPVSWSFGTGDGRRLEWHFSTPRTFAGKTHNIMRTLYADGRLVVIHRYAGRLYVSVSVDGGETLVRSEPIDIVQTPNGSVVNHVGAAYDAGTLYMAYVFDGYTWPLPESFFVRSLSADLMVYAAPEYLEPLAPASISGPSSLAVTDDGSIYRVWPEECPYGVFQSECDSSEIYASYLQKLDTSGIPLYTEKIGDWNFDTPTVYAEGNTVYVAKTYDVRTDDNVGDPMIEIFEYTAGMRKIGGFAEYGAIIQDLVLFGTSGNRMAVSWFRSDGIRDLHNVFVGYMDTELQTLGDEILMSSTDDSGAIFRCSKTKVLESGTVALLTGFAAHADDPVNRGIHLSNDGGVTFHTSIWFENLGPYFLRKIADQPFDEPCGDFEYDEASETIHALWKRFSWSAVDGYMGELVRSNARRTRPCSRPEWTTEEQPVPVP